MLYANAICKTNEKDKWFQSYEDAQKLANEIQDHERLIEILNSLGNLNINVNKDYNKALEYYRIALEKALELNSMDMYYQALLNLTNTYEKLGQYNNSIEEYKKAKEIFKQRGNFSNFGTVCNNIAIVYKDYLHDIDSALKYFLEGYNFVKDIETNMEKMMIHIKNIALVYTNLGKYEITTEYYMKLLDIVKNKGTRKQLAEAYTYLGVSYANANKGDEAIKYYQQALEIAKELNEEQLQADIYTNFAIKTRSDNDYTESLKYYTKAAEIYQKLQKWDQLEQSYAYMGINSFDLRNFEDAINFYWKAADAAKRTNDWSRIAAAYGNIANSFWQLNIENKAFEFFQEAANIYSKIGDYNRAGNMIYQITNIYEKLKQHQKAAEFNKIEYEYYQKSNNIEMKYWSSSRLSHNLWRADNFKEAAEWFSVYADRARDFNKPKDILYGLLSSADCYYKIGNHEKAIEILMRALELEYIKENPTSIWQATIDIADNYLLLGKLEKAEEYSKKAFELAEQNKKLDEKAEVLVIQSKIFEARQEFERSIQYRDQAFDILRIFKYNKYKMKEYENYSKLYEKLGNPKLALKYCNLSKIYEMKFNDEDEERYLSDWYRKDEEKEAVFSLIPNDCVFLLGSDISKLGPTYLDSPKEIATYLLETFANIEDVDTIIENKKIVL
jgi:tetratricopeptide (TPR) repeat protein